MTDSQILAKGGRENKTGEDETPRSGEEGGPCVFRIIFNDLCGTLLSWNLEQANININCLRSK